MDGSDRTVEAIAAAMGEALLGIQTDRGETTLVVDKGSIRKICRVLRDGYERFVHLSDVCAVDYLGMGLEPRFAVVYHLYSPTAGRRLRLKVPVEESDPAVPSVVEVWPAANWQEREVFDMFGIRFDGHPNLTRILMPDDATMHPLRKDVPLGDEDVQFSHNVISVRRPHGGEPSGSDRK